MAETTAEPEVDEDGIPIQKYRSMVLVVVPGKDFAEETLRYARSSLYNVHVGTYLVAVHPDDLAKGRLQDEFLVDGALAGVSLAEYSGVLFVGGEGASELGHNADAQRLAKEALAAGKLIGAWGQAVEVLISSGVLRGKRCTGHPDLAPAAKRAGAKFSGREIELADHIVTGRDDAVGMRFGQRLAQVVGI